MSRLARGDGSESTVVGGSEAGEHDGFSAPSTAPGWPALSANGPSRRSCGSGGPCVPRSGPGTSRRTAHVQAAYPFVAEAGLGTRGVLIGRDVYGGPFVIDPWLLYQEGRLHDPNMVILGRQDFGKSALVKTLCVRQRLFGRRVEVTDPKGEYDRLIRALGGVVLRLEPGGEIQLNPLERIGSDEQRQALLQAVARAILARELHQHEAVGLTAALAAADAGAGGREVCIPDVVAELRDPSERTAGEMNVPARRARVELRDCSLALHRLCAGPLRGMFDGPTNAGEATWDAPAISLDVSQLGGLALDDTAIAITMICATAFLDAKRRQRTREALRGGARAGANRSAQTTRAGAS